MAKKSKKTNKELLQEIREEGMFKEASDFTNKKKKYVFLNKECIKRLKPTNALTFWQFCYKIFVQNYKEAIL